MKITKTLLLCSLVFLTACAIYRSDLVFSDEKQTKEIQVFKRGWAGFLLAFSGIVHDSRLVKDYNYYKYLNGITTINRRIDRKTYDSLSDANKGLYRELEKPGKRWVGPKHERRLIKITHGIIKNPIFHAYEFCKEQGKELGGIVLKTRYGYSVIAGAHDRSYYVTCVN